ncbi:MAG: MMPL family transporter, partial [Chloroflexota bacterium]|nr:MMPL family transporter [Chloroflexota bacterium]
FYYRLPGLVSVLALLIYTALTFSVYKLLGVTLTLAGIAGFILSIGMAVDANVLIFARLKDELRSGKGLVQAVEAGFDHAWPSIRDSNISSMITSAILFWFGRYTGASIITGFALTLFIGVAVSMFTAITVTRTFLRQLILLGINSNSRLFTDLHPETDQPARTAAD